MAKKKIRKPNPTYTHDKIVDLSDTKIRILSLDPGSRNMGVAVVGLTKSNQVKVLANSIMTNPLHDLKGSMKEQLELFRKELDEWVSIYKPKGIIMERFQARSAGGPLIELVCLMLGIVLERYNLSIRFIPAAQWKNAFNRRFNEYELNTIYKYCKTTPHQLDAILIGCYGLQLGSRDLIKYSPDSIIKQAALTSRLKLINRKLK